MVKSQCLKLLQVMRVHNIGRTCSLSSCLSDAICPLQSKSFPEILDLRRCLANKFPCLQFWRNIDHVGEQEGVHVDSQLDGSASAESDGNKLANVGEYTSYILVIRNTGVSQMEISIPSPETLEAFNPPRRRPLSPKAGLT